MRKIEDIIGVSRITLFGVSIIFGLLFHISFLGVIAMWYAIVYSLEKVTGLKYTLVFETTLLIFIILSTYLGTSLGFYDIFWWWDKMLHFMYGFCFAFIGYKIIESVFKKRGVKNQLFITVAFSFCFSVAIGGIWEIFEYFFDKIGLYIYSEQWYPLVQTSPGLSEIDDTMNDIIIETISALVLNSMLYTYYHFGFFTFFGHLELILKEKKKKIQKKMKKGLKVIEEKVEEIIKKND